MAAGQQLRSLRERRGITVRDVEEASRRIADATRDKRYRISNGWLVQLEKRVSPPNIHQLFALGATYRVHFFELLRLYGIHVEEEAKYEAVANPEVTRLFSPNEVCFDLASPGTTRLDAGLAEKLPGLTFEQSHCESQLTYAQLGSDDMTMHPLIRPGAILAIDTSQNKVQAGRWNELDRPIYFVELRDGYACGWCERSDNKLRIVSYQSSSLREFKYPQEAEIVGRVVAYYTPCVDLDAKQHATTS